MPYTVDEIAQILQTENSIVLRLAEDNKILDPVGWINGRVFRTCAKDPRLNKTRSTRPVNRQNWQDTEDYLSYLAGPKQLDVDSVRCYRVQLHRLLLWAGENPFNNVPAITPLFPVYMVDGGIEGSKLSPVTMDGTCDTVRRFFVFAQTEYPERYQGITRRWVDSLRMGRKNGAHTLLKDPKIFDVEAVREVMKIKPKTLTDRRDLAAIAFLFLSGMRIGAFVSLPANCVDLKRLTVKQVPAMGVKTKNRKAAITSLLNLPDLLEPVRDWDHYVRTNGGADALWFLPLTSRTHETLGAGISESINRDHILRRNLRKMAEKYGFHYLSPHALRHGFAVYGIKNAKNMVEFQAVSQNLMHDNIGITSGIYSQLTADDVNKTITHLGAASIPTPAPEDNTALLLQVVTKLLSRPDLLQAVMAA